MPLGLPATNCHLGYQRSRLHSAALERPVTLLPFVCCRPAGYDGWLAGSPAGYMAVARSAGPGQPFRWAEQPSHSSPFERAAYCHLCVVVLLLQS